MNILKQSTAVNVKLGPYLDKDDAVTEETGITPVVEVSKNFGAFGARNSATAITHDAEGWFVIPLDTTDTGTLGPLTLKSHDNTVHLPVWERWTVVPANVYDSLVSGSDTLDVQVTGMGAGTVTAAAIATDAIDDDAIATGAIATTAFASGAIDAAALAADAANEIADAILSRNVSNVEATAAEHTLCTIILAMLENAISGTTMTIKRTDGSTTHATKTLTTNAAADPITGIQ